MFQLGTFWFLEINALSLSLSPNLSSLVGPTSLKPGDDGRSHCQQKKRFLEILSLCCDYPSGKRIH